MTKQTLSPATLTAIHAGNLPASLTVDAIDRCQPFGGIDCPMTPRESALRPDETRATFYSPDGTHALATLTRPRMYGDSAAAEPGAAGLYRLNLADGRLVACFARVPTLAYLRKALRDYLRPVDPQTVAEATDAQCKAEIASAAESVAQNLAAAADSEFDRFRASAMTRAARVARKGAIWAAALCDGCQTCDGAGAVRKAPGFETACPNCQPSPAPTLESIVAEAEAPAEAPESVDLTPAWSGLMPALIAALRNGTAQGQAMAEAELMRLAAQVDRINAQGQRGGFPLWAIAGDKAAATIDDSLRLGVDLADPFGPDWLDSDCEFFGPAPMPCNPA